VGGGVADADADATKNQIHRNIRASYMMHEGRMGFGEGEEKMLALVVALLHGCLAGCTWLVICRFSMKHGKNKPPSLKCASTLTGGCTSGYEYILVGGSSKEAAVSRTSGPKTGIIIPYEYMKAHASPKKGITFPRLPSCWSRYGVQEAQVRTRMMVVLWHPNKSVTSEPHPDQATSHAQNKMLF
jgi:hypothetical protein